MAETNMVVPTGEWTLRRPHNSKGSPLRAWSAADLFTLDHLAESQRDLGRVLIVNDEFGALTVALSAHLPVTWSDSALSRTATEANAATNGIEPIANRAVHGDDVPSGPFDTVIVRVPKTGALLEYQLSVISGLVTPASVVIGAGMAKHIHRSTTDLFEALIGATTTSKAVRKARLIHAEAAGADHAPVLPSGFVAAGGVRVAQRAGTFSAGRVDIGTALLIETLLAEPFVAGSVVDVGCGNGVIAASLATNWPNAQFVLTDASDLAIAAARETWKLNDLPADRASFAAVAGTAAIDSASAQMVVTNPPFHQGHALDTDMTESILSDIARIVVPRGSVYVVAQRHLNLHTRLRRWFDSVDVRSGHPSHVVLAATEPIA